MIRTFPILPTEAIILLSIIESMEKYKIPSVKYTEVIEHARKNYMDEYSRLRTRGYICDSEEPPSDESFRKYAYKMRRKLAHEYKYVTCNGMFIELNYKVLNEWCKKRSKSDTQDVLKRRLTKLLNKKTSHNYVLRSIEESKKYITPDIKITLQKLDQLDTAIKNIRKEFAEKPDFTLSVLNQFLK